MPEIWTTEAFRDQAHRSDNRYRFNEAEGYWEFDDGVGPWAQSAFLKGKDHAAGALMLRHLCFEPTKGGS